MERHPTEETLRLYGELQFLYEAQGGYGIQDSINRVCRGLKIDEAMASKEFDVLSGGEKTRVMLAKLILGARGSRR
jgi:ATPase subunit of ABC transporter with duplicated ATPase domains